TGRHVPGALLRVGRLDRFHEDHAALIPLDGLAPGARAITESRSTRAPHDDCRRQGSTLTGESPEPWMSHRHAVLGMPAAGLAGAQSSSPGFIAAAEGGTLFLDEIADMPLPAQTKLLRVLEERAVVPLGEVAPRRVDVRVIAASQYDLRQRVAEGKFRNDL